jgi:glycosyltransferase involved in cell wall biosynthesis
MTEISVVIPTKDRANLLDSTLASIARQTLNPQQFEVLVVDNGSRDHTQTIALSYQDKIPNLRYLHCAAPGLHEGRHAGLKASEGQILTYADDDIDALPTWLEGVLESFREDKKIGIVGGKDIPWYESMPPVWMDDLWVHTPEGRYLAHFSLLDFGDTPKDVHPHFVFGCNFSIRKDVLMTVGGFHPDGMPANLLKYRGDGETYVAQRVTELGYRTRYNPKASVKHWVPASRMTVEYIKKRAFAEGITQSYTDTRRKTFGEMSLKERIKNWLKLRIKRVPADPLFREMRESFLEGYRFHQQELQKDKALLNWVLKDNYL